LAKAEPGHKQTGGLFVPDKGPGHWPGAACKADARCSGTAVPAPGDRWQRSARRLQLQRAGAVAEIDLGDDARFWPCDEALGRWRSIAHGGAAKLLYE